jgi:hypothetical protein
MPQESTNSAAFQCVGYTNQYADWLLVNDCYLGTKAIRGGGSNYLPQNPKEPTVSFNNRLARANFWNAYKRTVDGLVGMIFRKNPVLGEDVPGMIKGSENVEGHWENIDLKGKHGDVFCKEASTKAINNGHHFVLVEMPPPLVDDEGNIRSDVTAAEASLRRPYWVHVDKGDVINWRTEQDSNGRTCLTQVTIKETIYEPDGEFGEIEVTQYRVLRPGSWVIYREQPGPNQNSKLEVYDSGSTTLDFIPLAPLYATYDDYFQSTPPLIELAYENLRHYRLQADLDYILHVANVPILVRIMPPVEDESAGEMVIGGGALVDLPAARSNEQESSLQYVEHQGSAIGKAQEEIANSKSNMAALGLLLLSQKIQVQRTASEATLDYEAESSELASMVRGIQDGIELALMYHAEYLNLDSGGSITLNKDFTRFNLTPELIRIYADMVKAGDMTHETMWKMLEKGELLPAEFESEAERLAIDKGKKERQAMMPQANAFSQTLVA